MENNTVNLSNSNLQRQNSSTCSKSPQPVVQQVVQQVVQPTNTAMDRRNKNTEIIAQQKSQIMQVDKQKLADIILKQNNVIIQQSSQMMDLVKLVNEIDNSQNVQDENLNIPTNNSDLQRNINILKNRNDVCKEASELRQHGVKLFESSIRIQFVLFSLFILVLFWLIYHYMSPDFE
jgi:hypothetical protein